MPTEHRTNPTSGRVAALVIGCLLLLPALGALVAGGGLALGYSLGRDASGYFGTKLDRIESPRVAVTTERVDFDADAGGANRVIDYLDAQVRLRVANADSDKAVFVGVAAQADVDRYLAGVAYDEVRGLRGRRPIYRPRTGRSTVTPPTTQDFWVVRASGRGSQELVWPVTSGRWVAVVMNADGSAGVAADVDVGVKAGFVLPLALILLGIGVVATVVAVALIVFGAQGLGRSRREVVAPASPAVPASPPPGPVRLEATLDDDLSRWLWLVKWLLAIPHFVVLFFLWLAFLVLTVIAGFAILFTGRYPRGIFEFNVGVMRWSWRVSYYATSGGIGTDRYPPFSLHADPTYPASLDVEPPAQLSRGLVLVKWWLLAIPHYLIVGLISSGTFWGESTGGNLRIGSTGGGLLSLLVLIAGVILLFRGRYPRSLFDLIVGLNRWIFRVVAYAGLMTDSYPPFRLDQGGSEHAPRSPDGAPNEPIIATTEAAEQ